MHVFPYPNLQGRSSHHLSERPCSLCSLCLNVPSLPPYQFCVLLDVEVKDLSDGGLSQTFPVNLFECVRVCQVFPDSSPTSRSNSPPGKDQWTALPSLYLTDLTHDRGLPEATKVYHRSPALVVLVHMLAEGHSCVQT